MGEEVPFSGVSQKVIVCNIHSVTHVIFSLTVTAFQGAQTTIHCAVDPGLVNRSGKYYDNCKEKEPNKLALDNDLCNRVWNVTLDAVSDFI